MVHEGLRVTNINHISATPIQFTDFDIVVVGSGPSGAMCARTFAEKGYSVLVLEFGNIASPGAIHTDHQAPFSRAVGADNVADADPWTACCVGGGMQFYDAITFRYRKSDLSASKFLSSDMLLDWPISLSDLEPHYLEVERLLEVSGASGNTAHPLTARGRALLEGMHKMGLPSKPVPLAIRTPDRDGGCSQCSACDERVCPTGAKASILSRGLFFDAGFPGSIEVRFGCFVNQVLTSSKGRVTGLECFIPFTGEVLEIPAGKVVLCANAIQSSALLLRSRTKVHSRGVGNEYDLVGRGLSFKISGYSTGRFSDNDSPFDVAHFGPHATVYSDHYYEHDEVPSGFGGLIYEANLPTPRENCGLLRLHYIAGEEPWSHNRISLSDTTDGSGVPLIRFEYRNSEMDLRRIDFLAQRSEEILGFLGAEIIEREPYQHAKGSSHLHGTCRSGHDPEDSVTDPNGLVHGHDNLYVMDGSVMNFAGNSNPTHTIMANARRMAMSIT